MGVKLSQKLSAKSQQLAEIGSIGTRTGIRGPATGDRQRRRDATGERVSDWPAGGAASGGQQRQSDAHLLSHMTSGSAAADQWGEWGSGPSPHVTHDEILQQTEVIETVAKAKEAVKWIWTCRDKEDGVVIAVDLEGVHLGKGGYATLIQIATLRRNVFVFDIQSEPAIIKVVAPLLTSKRVVKVFHDCKADTYALMLLGIDLSHVFDTAVAHVVIQIQDEPDKVPVVPCLNKVVELYGDGRVGTNGEKDNMKDVYRYQYDLWAVRPLTEEMLVYAAADVYCLVPDVFRNMRQKIRDKELLSRMIWESMMCHINKPAVKASKKLRKKKQEADAFAQKIDSAASPVELDNKEVMLLHYIDLTEERLSKIAMSSFVARTIQAISVSRRRGDYLNSQNYLLTVSEAKRDAESRPASNSFQLTPS